MIPKQRRLRIIEKLQEQDICSIDDLKEELGVSRITIQRDVNLLVKQGIAEKIHGGLQLKRSGDSNIESRFDSRLKQSYKKKVDIAHKTLGFIDDGSIIFLDSSTTVYTLAKEIFKRKYVDLTIITSSPAIIFDGMHQDSARLISTGGELRPDFNMFAGSWVLEFLANVNINSAFISAAGVSIDGNITSNNRDLANTIKEVFKRSDEINLLVDSSKFNKSGMLNVESIKNCTRVITDSGIESEMVKKRGLFEGIEVIF